jgi:hypothetical protein
MKFQLWASTYTYFSLSVMLLRKQKQRKRNILKSRVCVCINCRSHWCLCLGRVVKFSYIQLHCHFFFFTPQGRFTSWSLLYKFIAISAFCKQGGYGRFHIQCVPCHHGMAHPHVEEAGQLWMYPVITRVQLKGGSHQTSITRNENFASYSWYTRQYRWIF